MATKLTRLTHKIATQLHLVAESLSFAVLAPEGQSGNFWIILLQSLIKCTCTAYLWHCSL